MTFLLVADSTNCKWMLCIQIHLKNCSSKIKSLFWSLTLWNGHAPVCFPWAGPQRSADLSLFLSAGTLRAGTRIRARGVPSATEMNIQKRQDFSPRRRRKGRRERRLGTPLPPSASLPAVRMTSCLWSASHSVCVFAAGAGSGRR